MKTDKELFEEFKNNIAISNLKNECPPKTEWRLYSMKKRFLIILSSIIGMLVGSFSVFAATGGTIEGIPALDWLGLKFSDKYIEYKQPVENQVLAFENTSVQLTSTLCNEGLTILEFDVKLSEEDYEKLKIDQTVITDEYLEMIENLKSETKNSVIRTLKNEKYNEEMQKGNYDINIDEIEISNEDIEKKYNEEISNYDKQIEERKNTLFTIALTLNNDQKGGTYNYDKYNPDTEWYANIYVDDEPYYVASMQKLEKVNKYEYKIYNYFLISDDILGNKSEFKINLKNNKLVNMADWKVRILGDNGIEETAQKKSDTWFGNVSTMNLESDATMMKLSKLESIDLPGEFEVNVSKDNILNDSIILDNLNIKSEFRNITQTAEKAVKSPIQTIVRINHSASKQSSSGVYANRYINNPEIEYMPLTNKYKVYDANGKELSCTSLTNKRTLIYSNGTREDYDRHDIPNKNFDNATWETIEYLLIENTDTEYIKIVPVEILHNPVDGEEDTGKPIYYDMNPIIINFK